jgi:purine-binding chemotaxis protein CheW
VAEVDQKRVGLIVDAASEVLKIPPSEIDAPPNVFEEGELNYVTGVGKLQGRLIMMVELSKILQRGELRRLGEFADTHTPPAAEAASA